MGGRGWRCQQGPDAAAPVSRALQSSASLDASRCACRLPPWRARAAAAPRAPAPLLPQPGLGQARGAPPLPPSSLASPEALKAQVKVLALSALDAQSGAEVLVAVVAVVEALAAAGCGGGQVARWGRWKPPVYARRGKAKHPAQACTKDRRVGQAEACRQAWEAVSASQHSAGGGSRFAARGLAAASGGPLLPPPLVPACGCGAEMQHAWQHNGVAVPPGLVWGNASQLQCPGGVAQNGTAQVGRRWRQRRRRRRGGAWPPSAGGI